MPGLAVTKTSKERAGLDVRLLTASTRKKDGIYANKTFTDIQREVHAEVLASGDYRSPNQALMRFWQQDGHSIARGVVATKNPRAFAEYDYSLVPDYEELVEQINRDDYLTSLPLERLYKFAIRGTTWPLRAARILEIARLPVTPMIEAASTLPEQVTRINGEREISVTIDTTLDNKRVYVAELAQTSTPDSETSLITPGITIVVDPYLRIAPASMPNEPIKRSPSATGNTYQNTSFSLQDAHDVATPYLEKVQPKEYEIPTSHLKISTALSSINIRKVDDADKAIEVPEYKYPTQEDLINRLSCQNRHMSGEEISEAVKLASLKVARLYGVAMAVRQYRGNLPEGSPNMASLIEILGSYSVTYNEESIIPYRWLTAAGYRTVLTREIPADMLLTKSFIRAEDDFIKKLGEALEAQRYGR